MADQQHQDHCGESVPLSVYLLTGQSNSLGISGRTESECLPGCHPADTATWFWWSNVDCKNTAYPPVLYGKSDGWTTALQTQQGDGDENPCFWGPEFGFARALFDAGERHLAVIKASRGGGGNAYWDQDTFSSDANAGHMWGHLRDSIDAALEILSAQRLAFRVCGLMYLQGESNSADEASVTGTRLLRLIENVRLHIHARWPEAARDLRTVVGEIAASNSNPNRIETTRQQAALARQRSDVTFVPTHDLPLKSDGIHFGREEKLQIGEQFAAAFIASINGAHH